MNNAHTRNSLYSALIATLAVAICFGIFSSPVSAGEAKPADKQRTFATPDEAIKALLDATKAKDRAEVNKIFGPMINDLMTGDPVEDAADFQEFSLSLAKMCTPSHSDENTIVLNIGGENWPFPIPLVKANGVWFFNTAAGKDEIINRNVGEDELNTISVCKRFVLAEREYFLKDRDGNGILQYARRFKSSEGKRDGLYWDPADGEELSPFGPLIADAQAEGYSEKPLSKSHRAFHGYYFKILTEQGADAPGGKYSYIINGNMVAGFAMVAYPSHWGESGIMTFIVNQQGQVYQCNLGEKTTEIAAGMKEYDPDSKWTLVGKETSAK